MSKTSHGHSVLEVIKIPVTLDGDLAASICNAFTYCDMNDAWDEVAFCEHTIPKINALVLELNKELDIENKEEK